MLVYVIMVVDVVKVVVLEVVIFMIEFCDFKFYKGIMFDFNLFGVEVFFFLVIEKEMLDIWEVLFLLILVVVDGCIDVKKNFSCWVVIMFGVLYFNLLLMWLVMRVEILSVNFEVFYVMMVGIGLRYIGLF